MARERRAWESVPVDEAIEQLADAGLLTERQAEAYVLREIEAVPRPEAAEQMDISMSSLDDRLGEARQKVKAAEATVEAVRDVRYRPLPTKCEDCGEPLGSTFSENDAGEAICLDCAGVET